MLITKLSMHVPVKTMYRKKVLTLMMMTIMFVPSLAMVQAGGNNNPNKILGNPDYVLNILGKKDDWNPVERLSTARASKSLKLVVNGAWMVVSLSTDANVML